MNMDNISSTDLTRAEMWIFITTLAYFLMNGAQIFETAVVVPKWTASPPGSFQILKDIDLKTFWIVTHTLHEITFILAIIFCWKIDPVRNWLLILFAVHFAVRVWTLAYFAPNIIEFQQIANSGSSALNLMEKAAMWRKLNYIRVGLFLAVSLGLIPLCIYIWNLRIK